MRPSLAPVGASAGLLMQKSTLRLFVLVFHFILRWRPRVS